MAGQLHTYCSAEHIPQRLKTWGVIAWVWSLFWISSPRRGSRSCHCRSCTEHASVGSKSRAENPVLPYEQLQPEITAGEKLLPWGQEAPLEVLKGPLMNHLSVDHCPLQPSGDTHPLLHSPPLLLEMRH